MEGDLARDRSDLQVELANRISGIWEIVLRCRLLRSGTRPPMQDTRVPPWEVRLTLRSQASASASVAFVVQA